MGKYFGTDGIRGKANQTLNVERAFLIGQCLGNMFYKEKKARIVVGKDTRLSSSMFEHAIAAGAASTGGDVYLVGYCPTPVISYLSKNEDFDCGVMISASHNPFYDNGIKIFSHDGVKLSAKLEEEIEAYIDGLSNVELKSDGNIGEIHSYNEGLDKYLDWMQSLVDIDLSHLNIALDCANGSATTTALKLLERFGAKCTVIHNEPNGVNINTNCGSTHPEELQELMKQGNYDLGCAFDGDADRLIAVNSRGELVDGDAILYICGQYLKSIDKLNKNTVVTTVMANLGYFKAMEAKGIDSVSTQVGDKYVYESMVNHDYVLGGEQSGHIIFKQHATTGDGLLTACKILEVMCKTSKSIEELCDGLVIYPQLLINVPVQDKQATLQDPIILAEVAAVEKELGADGRILVRPSGTEPLVRVMVEAKTDEICEMMVKRVTQLIK